MQKSLLSRIFLSVFAEEAFNNISLLKNYYFIEYRFDNLINYSNLQNLFSNKFTIAANHNNLLTDESKHIYYKDIISYKPTYLDIPIDFDADLIKELVDLCRENSSKFISSYHNIYITPSYSELIDIFQNAVNCGADIVKIVVKASNDNDLQVLRKLYKQQKINTQLIAFPIGEFGREFRLESLKLGAPFCFASHENFKKTAAGQYSFSEVYNHFITN